MFNRDLITPLPYIPLQLTLTHYSPMLLFYTPLKHQKTFRFSDVFRGYRKVTPGCNGLSKSNIAIYMFKVSRALETAYNNFSTSLFLRHFWGQILLIICSFVFRIQLKFILGSFKDWLKYGLNIKTFVTNQTHICHVWLCHAENVQKHI